MRQNLWASAKEICELHFGDVKIKQVQILRYLGLICEDMIYNYTIYDLQQSLAKEPKLSNTYYGRQN